MSNFEDVKKFMETFGQKVRTKPQFPDEKTMQLRYDLIKEELNELETAMKTKNRKKIGGSIINMSSQMGHVGAPIRSVYNMTKAGLEGLTKGMAIDLAKNNIRVNSVCPTFVDTPMTKNFFKNKKFKVEVLKKIPLGRIAEVSDVATAVAFLASDASSMITGTSLLIDGGWTAI